jgi:hypothetical protein
MFVSLFLLAALSTLPGEPMLRAEGAVHVKVYYEAGRFGGWPANHGMWCWGNEILVGYGRGYYRDLGAVRHHFDRDKPEEHWLARSLDGGVTWAHEHPAAQGSLVPRGKAPHGIETPGQIIPPLQDLTTPIDFTHPDFAMTLRMDNVAAGTSRFEFSYDRGKTWSGPYRLPDFGAKGTAARTDYIVNDKHDAHVFLAVAKQNREEGRVIAARTTDGGLTWERLAEIGPEPTGFAIMPSTVRLGPTELFTTLRRREGTFRWISAWRSVDDGATWTQETDPVDYIGAGNPPMLNRLRDGRLCLTYGFRAFPFSIRAQISADGGKTWGPAIVLRNDGADRDIGYVRSVQRADGKVVTTYYINDETTGPDRYIGATIWDPNALLPITDGAVFP